MWKFYRSGGCKANWAVPRIRVVLGEYVKVSAKYWVATHAAPTPCVERVLRSICVGFTQSNDRTTQPIVRTPRKRARVVAIGAWPQLARDLLSWQVTTFAFDPFAKAPLHAIARTVALTRSLPVTRRLGAGTGTMLVLVCRIRIHTDVCRD